MAARRVEGFDGWRQGGLFVRRLLFNEGPRPLWTYVWGAHMMGAHRSLLTSKSAARIVPAQCQEWGPLGETMLDPNLAWLDAVTRLASPSETAPEALLMRQIDAIEAKVEGPARRFVQLASGSEAVHRLALAKALCRSEASVYYEDFRRASSSSWAAAVKAAHASPLLDTSRMRLRLHDRVDQVLLGLDAKPPLPLREVRPAVMEAVVRLKRTVGPGPLVFQCADRDFCLEYARAWGGGELASWSLDSPGCGAVAHLRSDEPFLWLDYWADWMAPEVAGAQAMGCPPCEEVDRLGRQGVQLDPLFHRLNGEGAGPAPTDEDEAPHLASHAWTTPDQGLDALVLAEEQHNALRAAAERARQGGRCVLLLHGPPGTGKSLAARCLAGSLGRRVYALDGARVRGKYFGQADRRVAGVVANLGKDVLVIDEADSWFGRRTGSPGGECSAHVQEVSTMLLMLERFQGVAVLTTNRLEALDAALWRRVDLVLAMPTPGVVERMALWGRVAPSLRPSTLMVLSALPLTGGDIDAAAKEASLHGSGEAELVAAARRRSEHRRLLG